MDSRRRLAVVLGHLDTPARTSSCSSANLTNASQLGVKEMAMELVMARVSGSVIYNDDIFTIPNIDASYAVLDAMISEPCALGPCVGWKIGMADAPTFTKLGLKEPARAPLFSSSIFNSPAIVSLPVHLKDKEVTIEAEIGFKFNSEFRPREQKYTTQEVVAGIEEMMCSIEVCGARFGKTDLSLPVKFADGGLNVAVVFGPANRDISKHVNRLANIEASLSADGIVCSSGTGKNVLGNPLSALVWLVNNLSRSGVTLKQGSSIISGALCKCKARKGQTVVAWFSGLGDISVTLS